MYAAGRVTGVIVFGVRADTLTGRLPLHGSMPIGVVRIPFASEYLLSSGSQVRVLPGAPARPRIEGLSHRLEAAEKRDRRSED